VDAVSDAVQECAGQAFVNEDLGPLFEGQVGGHDDALAFVGATNDLEEEFGTGFGEGNVAEFVEYEQVEFFQSPQ